MKPIISVIICTHNPQRDYLKTVLEALKSQTLPMSEWELLLIDNASDKLLSSEIDLKWHSNTRHIREEQLGLTPARLRGIHESAAETLVFVDDDNVLDFDYLEVALKISETWPTLGAWGGQIRPEFEESPPDWTKSYWNLLAIREFDRDQWSNMLHQHETTPCGAGICVRRIVAEKYADLVRHDPRRLNMDRKGNSLLSCGDTDLAFTACDIGLGTGLFASLKLTHLIPANRIQEEYLLKLVEKIEYSSTILASFRGKVPFLSKESWPKQLIRSYQLWKMEPRNRHFHKARKRGLHLAIKEISSEFV